MDKMKDTNIMPEYGNVMGQFSDMEPNMDMMNHMGPMMSPQMMMPNMMHQMGPEMMSPQMMTPNMMHQMGPEMMSPQMMMPFQDPMMQNPMMHMEYMYMYYKYMCKYLDYLEKCKCHKKGED